MSRFSLLPLLSLTLLTSFGCGGDDEDDRCNQVEFAALNTSLSAEVSSAGTVYINNPSNENCADYKLTLEAYLEQLKEFETCPGIAGMQSFSAAIDGAEASISGLPCN